MFINNLSFLNFPFLGRGAETKNRVQGPGSYTCKWFMDPVQNGWVGGGLCLAHFLIDLKSCVSGCAQPPRPGMYGKYEIR